jgi:hypothetical protein
LQITSVRARKNSFLQNSNTRRISRVGNYGQTADWFCVGLFAIPDVSSPHFSGRAINGNSWFVLLAGEGASKNFRTAKNFFLALILRG